MPSRRLLTVLGFLALLHLYIGWRLIGDSAVGPFGAALAVLLLALSTLLLPAGLLPARLKAVRFGEQITWAGLVAMGFFSSLLLLTVLRDAVLMLLSLASAVSEPWRRASAIGVPLLAAAISLIGYVNARRVARVVHVEVPIANLPPALHGYAIVQISDIHVGPTIKRGYLNAIVTKVNALKPDAIAITGDLVDGSVPSLRMHTEPLARLAARDGAFFVTGNHEYYSGAHEWIAELRRLGLIVLLNEHVVRERDGARLMIAGVPDYTAHLFDRAHRSDPARAAANAPDNLSVRILLAHQPRSAPAAAAAGFDLQLSGHTHGGQFFPWNLLVPLQQPFVAGLHRLSALWVYTSRGTGYWGPPKRFMAPSEITRVTLVPA